MSQAKVAISFEDDDDRSDLEAAASAEGVEVKEVGRGIEPITTLILIGAAAAVGSAVIGWLKNRKRKGKNAWGQIIDLRPGVDPKEVVRRDEDLEWGQVVIIVPSEDEKTFSVKMQAHNPDSDLEELSKLIFMTLSEGVFKTAKEIKETVEAILKDKGKVEVEEGGESEDEPP